MKEVGAERDALDTGTENPNPGSPDIEKSLLNAEGGLESTGNIALRGLGLLGGLGTKMGALDNAIDGATTPEGLGNALAAEAEDCPINNGGAASFAASLVLDLVIIPEGFVDDTALINIFTFLVLKDISI